MSGRRWRRKIINCQLPIADGREQLIYIYIYTVSILPTRVPPVFSRSLTAQSRHRRISRGSFPRRAVVDGSRRPTDYYYIPYRTIPTTTTRFKYVRFQRPHPPTLSIITIVLDCCNGGGGRGIDRYFLSTDAN